MHFGARRVLPFAQQMQQLKFDDADQLAALLCFFDTGEEDRLGPSVRVDANPQELI